VSDEWTVHVIHDELLIVRGFTIASVGRHVGL